MTEHGSISAGAKKKKQKLRVRTFVFILTAAIAAGLYLSRSLWLPRLKGISKQYHMIINDGVLAQGNYPIEVSGGNNFQLCCTGSDFAVLTDAYIYFYNEKGELIRKRQHGYINPVMRCSGENLLIYENGGNDFCIENRDDVIYEKNFGTNIIFARISAEGYIAAVTTSRNYDCEMFIYDPKGNMIYERKCFEHVNDLCFNEESTGCTISFINAEDGSITTSVEEINFRESSEVWKSPGLDTLGLDVYCRSGGAFVLGLDACGYIANNGEIVSFYRYDGELAGGSSDGEKSAVAVNNYPRRKYTLAIFTGDEEKPTELEFEQPLIDVAIKDDIIYVMSREMIIAYDFSGAVRATAGISDSYSGFARSSKYIYLKGFNKIDRIDYDC
ncbi:MAG: hypothetical protein IJ666_04505 [Ruminococcus sp.]|nr:hypothetical protein [Ruminococcus sp.]